MRKKITIRLFMIFAGIILALILGEISFRFFHIYPEYDYPRGLFQENQALGFSMRPNFSGNFVKQEFSTKISTNSLGLRDIEYSLKKPVDYRILALGDSFTWGGYGTDLNQTFVKILEQKLNLSSLGTNYQVINAGVPAYGIEQEYAYLLTRGYQLKPDLVMLNFFVGNDFFDNQFQGIRVQNGELVIGSDNNYWVKTRSFAIENSHLYRVLENVLVRLFGNFIRKNLQDKLQDRAYASGLYLTSNSGIKTQIDKKLAVLDQIKSYLDSKGIKFIIVCIPTAYQVDNNLRREFESKYFRAGQDYNMQNPQQIIDKWGQENKTYVYDLLPELSRLNHDNDFYWKLNVHFNIKGNETVGKIIYNRLVGL